MEASTAQPTSAIPGVVRRESVAPKALEWAALFALLLWTAAPIVYLLVRAAAHGESLSGGESPFVGDQLQYLSWIRSSGEHLLAGDGFALSTGGNVFLHPLFVISGLLWRAGIGIVVAFLLWAPVAAVVLWLGFRGFTTRMLVDPWARAAALILALFFVTPAYSVAAWTVGSSGLGVLGGELAPAGTLYGYFPIVLTVGLLALFMVGVDRIAGADRRPATHWYAAATAAAGLIVSWLHPWQGATGLIVAVALLLGRKPIRRRVLLAITAVATAIPLGYYLLLSRLDGAWKVAHLQSPTGHVNVFLLILALAPLAAFAAVGLRGKPGDAPLPAVLWLWPAAALAVYVVSPEYAPHALEGIALPLAVLATRGWQRLRWPVWAAVAAIAVATLPGLAYMVKAFHAEAVADQQPLLLKPPELHALSYLAHDPRPGGVLASARLATAVPAYTGRRSWIGHPIWTPGYAARAAAATSLFEGRLRGPAATAFLRQAGARFLLSDCEPGFDRATMGRLVVAERRFGCAAVYELAVPSRAASF